MKLVILDRDGVINEDSDNYIRSVDEWIPIPGSIEAIARLHKAGYIIAVATNQSGIGRGYYDLAELSAMHDKMIRLVNECGGSINSIHFCPHTPETYCNCRKPALGLIKQLESDLQVSAQGAWFVGDTSKDIEVARISGCHPVLVKTGKGKTTLTNINISDKSFKDVKIVDSLADFADYLLNGAVV